MLTLEPCPANLAHEEAPQYGGSLFFRENGTACCIKCGWTGVPTFRDGYASRWCPECQHEDDVFPRDPERVPRNAICPCGSGRKAKKCDCAEFIV